MRVFDSSFEWATFTCMPAWVHMLVHQINKTDPHGDLKILFLIPYGDLHPGLPRVLPVRRFETVLLYLNGVGGVMDTRGELAWETLGVCHNLNPYYIQNSAT
jgi:hypothetical protein